jgi:hypothetical protein
MFKHLITKKLIQISNMNSTNNMSAYDYMLYHQVSTDEAEALLDLIDQEKSSELNDNIQENIDNYMEYSKQLNEEDGYTINPYDPYDPNPFKNSTKITKNHINDCMTSTIISNNYNIISNCTICRDKPENEVVLSCKHVFCKECITKWLTNCAARCPNCSLSLA